MEILTGKSNTRIVEAHKLQDKKYREKSGLFAFEGIKLFKEAKKAGARFHEIFVTPEALTKYEEAFENMPVTAVSEEVYRKLTFENAPQGVFATAEYFTPKREKTESFVLFLNDVADPGNFGTVLRTADAFSVDAVYVSGGCADLYNPKTVRACMGSLFRVPVIRTDNLVSTVKDRQKDGFTCYATALDETAKDMRKVDYTGKIGVIIGNEGHGISAELLQCCNQKIIIPMKEGPESLNAAVASAVVMWEIARNRLP